SRPFLSPSSRRLPILLGFLLPFASPSLPVALYPHRRFLPPSPPSSLTAALHLPSSPLLSRRHRRTYRAAVAAPLAPSPHLSDAAAALQRRRRRASLTGLPRFPHRVAASSSPFPLPVAPVSDRNAIFFPLFSFVQSLLLGFRVWDAWFGAVGLFRVS
ncbi:hypothetical protein U1Q18_007362, partial [Sarracenia purpurea var. burkii]